VVEVVSRVVQQGDIDRSSILDVGMFVFQFVSQCVLDKLVMIVPGSRKRPTNPVEICMVPRERLQLVENKIEGIIGCVRPLSHQKNMIHVCLVSHRKMSRYWLILS